MNEKNSNPVLVEVRRGAIVEARSRGAIVAVEPDGRIVTQLGNPEMTISTRSAIKPIQAIPFITSGAADRFNVSGRELAVVCSSHNAEPFHTETVAALLARISLDESALRCGAHAPYDEATRKHLECSGVPFTQIHNNCSGKHTGMLATALHLGLSLDDYTAKEHPLQREIISIFTRLAGLSDDLPSAIDGCSAPTFGVPLQALALAFARLVEASADRERVTETKVGSQFQNESVTLPPQAAEAVRRVKLAIAARRIVAAMLAYPEMIGGTKTLDSDLMRAADGALICKVGAEAVHAIGVLPCEKYPCGLGIALKMEDGASRAMPAAVIETLAQLAILDETQQRQLANYHKPEIKNHRGIVAGDIRSVFTLSL